VTRSLPPSAFSTGCSASLTFALQQTLVRIATLVKFFVRDTRGEGWIAICWMGKTNMNRDYRSEPTVQALGIILTQATCTRYTLRTECDTCIATLEEVNFSNHHEACREVELIHLDIVRRNNFKSEPRKIERPAGCRIIHSSIAVKQAAPLHWQRKTAKLAPLPGLLPAAKTQLVCALFSAPTTASARVLLQSMTFQSPSPALHLARNPLRVADHSNRPRDPKVPRPQPLAPTK
jgi:hypothetical protein